MGDKILERFKKIDGVPYELLVLHFLSNAYPTEKAKENLFEHFERVLDVTGSQFLPYTEELNHEKEIRQMYADVEKKLPGGAYLSDFPETHPIWAEVRAISENEREFDYIHNAQYFQNDFYSSIDSVIEKIDDLQAFACMIC